VNALLGGGGDRGCYGRVVEDDGDGGGREIKILGEHLEGCRPVGFGEVLFSCHRDPKGGMCNIWQQLYTAGWNDAQLRDFYYERLPQMRLLKITK
jgi:hypothetical protein